MTIWTIIDASQRVICPGRNSYEPRRRQHRPPSKWLRRLAADQEESQDRHATYPWNGIISFSCLKRDCSMLPLVLRPG
jgi:hypothetical protein